MSTLFGYGIKGEEHDGLAFGNRKANWVRITATATALVYTWWCLPRQAMAKPREPKQYSVLDRTPGLTQTPDAGLQKKIAQREKEEAATKPRKGNVEVLSEAVMKQIRGGQTLPPGGGGGTGGGGSQSTFKVPNEPDNTVVQTTEGTAPDTPATTLRNSYLTGNMPWHKTFRDVNLSTGNLFKSFTDIQVGPGRGAGLALQRTYNSNEDRVGPFGVGWTHAYDIHMEDAGIDADGTEYSPRSDFFGGKHAYTRDADGLYTPPPYLFDELDSKYHEFLSGNFAGVDSDKQVGQDGTVKHFISEGNYASGHPQAGFPVPTRVCDYMEDRHSNRTNITYTSVTLPGGIPKKLLSTVTDPTGRSLTFSWSNLGTTGAPMYRISGVTGPQYSVTYQYNTEGNLWKVNLDPSGLNRTTTYGYTSVNDGNGHTADGLLSSISDPLGNTTSYSYWYVRYDEYGNPSAYTPTGTVWVGTITEPGGEAPGGAPRAQVYSIDFHSSPNTDIYTVIQDKTTTPGQLYLKFISDNRLRLKTVWGGYYTIHRGIYNYTYDDANNLIQEEINGLYAFNTSQPELYSKITRTFGPHGNVLTETVHNGYQTAIGTTTTEYYDASKYFQRKKVTDATGRVSEFDYYPKAKNTVTPNDPITKGRDGQLMWTRDPGYANSNSTSYGRQFECDYNQYGQKIWDKNIANVVTTLEYSDTWGNLTKVRQDPTGLNRTTLMNYDVTGKVISSTDPKGQTSTFAYNTLGQPTSATFPANGSVPAEMISYSYGVNGRTQSVTDNRGTTSVAYESNGDRVKSVTDPITGTISYTYAPSGERLTVTTPAGETTTYTYETNYGLLPSPEPDKMTRPLRSITDGQGRKVTLYYIADPLLAGNNPSYGPNLLGLLHSLRFNQTFNTNGDLLSYCESKPTYGATPPRSLGAATTTYYWRTSPYASWQNRVLSKNEYSYNALTGQKTANLFTDNYGNQRTETYTYDELSRLKTVNYGDGQTQSYSFDSMGNRVAKTDNLAGSETYSYNNANMLLNRVVGGTNQTYTNDTNGNTLSGNGRTMTWDSQNRIANCVTGVSSSQKTSTFTYGSDGIRRRMTVVSANGNPTYTTDYVLDGHNVVQELTTTSVNVNPVVTATYMMGPQGPLYKRPTNSTDVRWYIYDGGSNVTGEVDPAGNVTASKKHDVYGATRSSSGSATSKQSWQGGVGHQSDEETGLVYMRARYYAPELGRFQSEDRTGEGGNWYTYCYNDPLNYTDSSGNVPEWIQNLANWAGNHISTIFLIAGLLVAGAAVAEMQKLKNIKGGWGNLEDVRKAGVIGSAAALAGLATALIGIAAVGMLTSTVWNYVMAGVAGATALIAYMCRGTEVGQKFAANAAISAAFIYGITVLGYALSIGADVI